MELCLLGQFQVIVVNSLFKNSWDLFEYLSKIPLKLRSKTLKKILDLLFDLFPVDFFKILFNFVIDPRNKFL